MTATEKPYRAEFGAIHHRDASGFLFTITPASAADTVAKALNQVDGAPSRDQLVEIIMRETTDKITADGTTVGSPNVLVQGCRFIRGHRPGYERPEEAARNFAGFIADAVLAAFAGGQ